MTISTESFRKCRLKDSRKGDTYVDTRFSDFFFFPHQAVLRQKADIYFSLTESVNVCAVYGV